MDPAQALLEEVHRTAGHVAWLAAKVAGLDDEALVWGVTEEIDRPGSVDDDGEVHGGDTETRRKAAPNIWLQLYQAERKHLVDVSKAAVAAGASERMVAVFERVGTTYVAMIDRVLGRIGASPEQRAQAAVELDRELRALTAGDEEP